MIQVQDIMRAPAAVTIVLMTLGSCDLGRNSAHLADIKFPPTAEPDQSFLVIRQNEPITLVARARDPDGKIVGYEWQIPSHDGELISKQAIVQFAEHGLYSAAYRAMDDDGLWSNTAVISIQVGEPLDENYALRLNGGGKNDSGRVKILVDSVGFDEPGPKIDIGKNDFAIEFWLQGAREMNQQIHDSCVPNAWIYGNIVIDRDRYGQGRAYGISILDGRVIFGVTGSDGDNFSLCGQKDVLDGTWHHIAVTRNQRNGQLSLFVDGNLDARDRGPTGDISYPDNGIPGEYCDGRCFFSDPFLVVGAEKHDVGEKWRGFSGLIDDLRISSNIRYTNDFEVPRRPLAADEHTIALLHFDEGTGLAVINEAREGFPTSIGYVSKGGQPAAPDWVKYSDSDLLLR